MSVSINQIVYQYLQFASEQQRGLVNIARDISQINSRVTDIINLYANGNRLSQFDRRLREVREKCFSISYRRSRRKYKKFSTYK